MSSTINAQFLKAVITNVLLVSGYLIVTACDSQDPDVIDLGEGLPFEPPYEGSWTGNTGQSLDIEDDVDNDDYSLRDYPITVFIGNPQITCGGPAQVNELQLKGRMNFGAITLFSNTDPEVKCIEGAFTDLITLKLNDVLDSTEYIFTNSRVEIDLGAGAWDSKDHGGLTLYMNQPRSIDNDSSATVTGCLYNNNVEGESFSGLITGFATGNRQRPVARELTADLDNRVMFRNLEFIDVRNMVVTDADNRNFRLTRITVPDQGIDIQCP